MTSSPTTGLSGSAMPDRADASSISIQRPKHSPISPGHSERTCRRSALPRKEASGTRPAPARSILGLAFSIPTLPRSPRSLLIRVKVSGVCRRDRRFSIFLPFPELRLSLPASKRCEVCVWACFGQCASHLWASAETSRHVLRSALRCDRLERSTTTGWRSTRLCVVDLRSSSGKVPCFLPVRMSTTRHLEIAGVGLCGLISLGGLTKRRPDRKLMAAMSSDFFDPAPEQQNVVLGSAVTLRQAEQLIASCQYCNHAAEIPFDYLLDCVTDSDPTLTDYILEQPAKCPRCRHDVTEKTLIEP